MTDGQAKPNVLLEGEDACVLPPDHPIPPEHLRRYSVERDPFAEQNIADYVRSQACDEVVSHVPSLDYTLSFHVGLMARVRSRSGSPDGNDPSPFDEVLRRFEQAGERFGHAIEVEDLQAVGMLLREGLISLTTAMHRRVALPQNLETPQVANFVGWADVLLNVLCGGGSNERLRQYLKGQAKEIWQLVNWLTHSRSADSVAAEIAMGGCESTLRAFIQLLERQRTGGTEECPSCHSRNIRTFFDIDIQPDGDYFLSCGACGWHNHPGASTDTTSDGDAHDEPVVR